MSDFIVEVFFPIILMALLLIGGILYIANISEHKSCILQSKMMGYEYNYSFYTDCMIKVSGKFIPLDNYRVINDK